MVYLQPKLELSTKQLRKFSLFDFFSRRLRIQQEVFNRFKNSFFISCFGSSVTLMLASYAAFYVVRLSKLVCVVLLPKNNAFK